jgi:predicted ribosomally synthesized peptide with SipW-like signal peptide
MSKSIALKRFGLLAALLAALLTAIVGTVAYHTARANETVTFTVAQFAKDGYALERTAPNDYFSAGESVTATIKESNTEKLKDISNLDIREKEKNLT